MAYKMVPEAPPSTVKAPKPEEGQKDTTPALTANQEQLRPNEPAAKAEEYGYIVTNQRYSRGISSMWFDQSGRLDVFE